MTAAFAGPGNVFSPSTVSSLDEMLLLASSVAHGAETVPALPRWGVQVGDAQRPRGLEGAVGLGKLLEGRVSFLVAGLLHPGAFRLELEDEDDGRRTLLAVGDIPLQIHLLHGSDGRLASRRKPKSLSKQPKVAVGNALIPI